MLKPLQPVVHGVDVVDDFAHVFGQVMALLVQLELEDILQRPLLYLSYYLKAHRTEYYDRLMSVRLRSDWEGWVKFFLQGVFEVSQSATATAREILELREAHRQVVEEPRLLDHLFEQPIISVGMVRDYLGCSYPKASKVVEQYAGQGLLREITGNQRNRRYSYEPFLALFKAPEFVAGQDDAPVETTGTENAK